MSEVERFMRAVLDVAAVHSAASEAKIAQAQRDGYRIVNGGQTTSYDDDGKCGSAGSRVLRSRSGYGLMARVAK